MRPRTSRRHSRRLPLTLLLLLLPLLLGGCITQALWNDLPQRRSHDEGSIDWSNGRTIATVALTPVALAGDAAIVTLWVWAACESDGGGCHDSCSRRCR